MVAVAYDRFLLQSSSEKSNEVLTMMVVTRAVLNFIFSVFFSASYTPGYVTTYNAFIFSLNNKEGISAFKSKVADPQSAIYRLSTYGPTFGRGYDIFISDKADSNKKSLAAFGLTYPAPSGVQDPLTLLAGSDYFTPDEWEVFYLA